MIIILLGLPGAGKGTQAKIICQSKELFHFSTGDILRNEVNQKSNVGQEIEAIINAGKLVSDKIILSIVEKIISETSEKLHITTLKFTSFWEYIRAGDPVGINILREGMALIDSGFFEPMQQLLIQGKMRPSPEAVWVYFSRAPRTMHNSRWHLLQGTLDLYWAVIDSAHAALMKLGEIPPTPSHVSDLLYEKMVKKDLLEKKYSKMMDNFYKLAKRIGHQELTEIRGKDYDVYLKDAQEFVDRMKKFITKQ